MRNKHISFAQVLRGKDRAYPSEPKSSNHTLLQLLEQWEQYPEEDYTLYLGKCSYSFHSQHSTSRMFNSRNQNEQEEEMFDSWIQRQSLLNANKENVGYQPRRTTTNEYVKPTPPSPKLTLNSQNKETSNGVKTMREPSSKQEFQQPSSKSRGCQNVGENVKMIKSKTSESDSRRKIASPSNHHNIEEISLEVQQITTSKGSKEYEKRWNNEGRKLKEKEKEKEKEKGKEKEKEPTQLIVKKQNEEGGNKQKNKQKIQSIISHTASHIHHQIADLANKYLTQDSIHESKQQNGRNECQEEDELLIGSADKNPLGQTENENLFSQQYSAKSKKWDEVDRIRREDAKNKLNDIMKGCFSKGNSALSFKREESLSNISQQPVSIGPNVDVGYSFASNTMESEKTVQTEGNQLRINHIQQIKSQLPSMTLKIEDSEELNFRKKYVKEEPIIVPNDHIQNIQSIHYDTSPIEMETPNDPYIPRGAFEAKLISSSEENVEPLEINLQRQRQCLVESEQYIVPYKSDKVSLEIIPPSIQIEYVKLKESQIIESSHSNNNVPVGANFESSLTQDRAPYQKTKLVSSQKLKVYSNSNKSSPAASHPSNQKIVVQNGVEVKTQPFVTAQSSIGSQNKKLDIVSKQIGKQRDGRITSPLKSIKQVRESIKQSIIYPAKCSPSQPVQTIYATPTEVVSAFTSNYTVPNSIHTNHEYPSYAQPSYTGMSKHTYNTQYTTGLTQNYYNTSTGHLQFDTKNTSPPFAKDPLPSYAAPKSTNYNITSFENKFTPNATSTSNSNSYYCFDKKKTEIPISTGERGTSQAALEVKYGLPKNEGKKEGQQREVKKEGQQRESKKEGQQRRSYLSDLQLKQSITVDEPRRVEPRERQTYGEEAKREVTSLLDKQLKTSIAQSMNASGEFNFDF